MDFSGNRTDRSLYTKMCNQKILPFFYSSAFPSRRFFKILPFFFFSDFLVGPVFTLESIPITTTFISKVKQIK